MKPIFPKRWHSGDWSQSQEITLHGKCEEVKGSGGGSVKIFIGDQVTWLDTRSCPRMVGPRRILSAQNTCPHFELHKLLRVGGCGDIEAQVDFRWAGNTFICYQVFFRDFINTIFAWGGSFNKYDFLIEWKSACLYLIFSLFCIMTDMPFFWDVSASQRSEFWPAQTFVGILLTIINLDL